MPFIATTLGAHWPTEQRPTSILETLIRAVIPAANPDFESLYHLVSLWWIEIDCQGIPQREIGFNDKGVPVVVGPLDENMGFWTDSSMSFAAKEHDAVDPADFETQWQRFLSTRS
jgi:hypothetical protein